MNPIFYIDFYKVGHVEQYPKGITQVWSNWTPRYSRTDRRGAVHFGLQYFIKRYLQEAFQKEFFDVRWGLVEAEYKEVISATLGVKDPKLRSHCRVRKSVFA